MNDHTPHHVPPSAAGVASRIGRALRVGVAATVGAALSLSAVAASGQPSDSTTITTAPTTTTTEAETTTTTAPTTESTASTTATTAADATSTTAADGGSTTTTAPPATTTTLSAEQAQERARAVTNLNLAKAADQEIANELRTITEQANLTIEKIEEAEQRLDRARILAERSAEQLQDSGSHQQEVEASLMVKAVEGYKNRSVGAPDLLFSEISVNDAIRQQQLLDEASSSTTELLEELRRLLEDRRLANVEAEQAAQEAARAQEELEAQLDTLKEQQLVQIGLKSEAERRIDEWAGELTSYAKEDAGIQQLIGERAAPVDTGIASPTTPSALGFQWPIQAPATSEYGYRIHPVYGSRRLHAGIDLGAAGGTPIATSNDGVVIFAGVRGGYGNTVIVDHGGGITTLYAHMSRFGSSVGQQVSRGDIVGYVGATGTATGNHLHFEVRVNGGAVNPRNYLP